MYTYFAVFLPSYVRLLRDIQLALKRYAVVFPALYVDQPPTYSRYPFHRSRSTVNRHNNIIDKGRSNNQ
jgi:hypothetical protein